MPAAAEDVISVSHLVAHQGASPSVTIPVVGAVAPDVGELWAHLAEPAEFFGVDLPSAAALADALGVFIARLDPVPALAAVTVTAVAGESRFVVTGAAVEPVHSDAVRIERCDVDVPLTLPEDPRWRRMAARTTSRADRDRLHAWLGERGYADAVPAFGACTPFLGALIWQRAGELVGVDNPEPVSVLAQLRSVLGVVRRVFHAPGAGEPVWWLSPDYTLHPVSAIGATAHPVTVPTFARLT
jgi:hypothetical protein